MVRVFLNSPFLLTLFVSFRGLSVFKRNDFQKLSSWKNSASSSTRLKFSLSNRSQNHLQPKGTVHSTTILLPQVRNARKNSLWKLIIYFVRGGRICSDRACGNFVKKFTNPRFHHLRSILPLDSSSAKNVSTSNSRTAIIQISDINHNFLP